MKTAENLNPEIEMTLEEKMKVASNKRTQKRKAQRERAAKRKKEAQMVIKEKTALKKQKLDKNPTKMVNPPSKYERKSIYNVEDVIAKVLPHAISTQARRASKVDFDGDLIVMSSSRYQVFKYKGTDCVTCGLKGAHFAKEKEPSSGVYHFNLYGINEDGLEVMMTKDHIIPKSKGGKNELKNYQPMCTICNSAKGALTPAQLMELKS